LLKLASAIATYILISRHIFVSRLSSLVLRSA
jgi:hypothetical protein